MNMQRLTYCLGIAVLAILFMGIGALELQEPADRVLAYVQKFKPNINIHKDGQVEKGKKSSPLFDGDTLRTDKDGLALVQFMDKSFANVKPQSSLIINGQVNNDKSTSARILLETGEIFMNVTRQVNSDYEVATNTSVASVKGTQFGANSDNYYYVLEGEVEVLATETGNTVTLTENMFAQVNEDGSIDVGELTDDDINRINQSNSAFDNLEPKILRLQFRDADGQLREIEIEYFENDNE